MKFSKVSLSACAVLALSSLVMAQEAQQGDLNTTETTMGKMSITQKRPTVVINNPSNNAHISANDIEKINVINVEDSLKYVPSLHIRKRYIGDRNSIISTRTNGTLQSALSLVYADGLLLSNLLGNSYAFPPRWALVGTSEIESMDVLYGPFSALLPGNSEGATVIMTTKRPQKFEASADVTGFTENFSLFGTNESYSGHQEQARIANKHGNLSWEIFANHLDSFGHPMTFATATVASSAALGGGETAVTGHQKFNAVDGKETIVFGATSIDHSIQDTVKGRLVYDIDQYTQVAFTAAKFYLDSHSNSETYLRDASGNRVYSGNVNIDGRKYTLSNTTFGQTKTKTENDLIGLTLNSKLSSQWRAEIAGSVYTTPKDIARTPSAAKPTADVSGGGSVTYGDGTGWKNLDLRSIYKSSEKQPEHTLTLGYHYDGYETKSAKYNMTNWTDEATKTTYASGFSGKTQTQALYVQDVWHIAPDWSVTAGLRGEKWEAYDGTRDTNSINHNDYASRDETFYSPKLSIGWDFSDDWTARFSMAKAYRMPTVGELFQTETRGSTTFFSDSNLRPENILSKELTLEHSLEQGYARFSFFDQEVEDMLYSQTDVSVTPNVTSVQNIDKTRIYGAEAAYQQGGFMDDLLEIGGSMTYTRSEIVANHAVPASEGKWVPRIPNIRLTAYGTYHISSAVDASLGYRYSGKQYDRLDNADVNRNVYGSSSAFSVLDAKLGYKVGKNLQAFIGVDNLTNCEYYAYHPYAQRTYSAQLKYTY